METQNKCPRFGLPGCDGWFIPKTAGPGRSKKFCKPSCRVRFHEERFYQRLCSSNGMLKTDYKTSHQHWRRNGLLRFTIEACLQMWPPPLTPAIQRAWNDFVELLYEIVPELAPAGFTRAFDRPRHTTLDSLPAHISHDNPLLVWMSEQHRLQESLKLVPVVPINGPFSRARYKQGRLLIEVHKWLLEETGWAKPNAEQFRLAQEAIQKVVPLTFDALYAIRELDPKGGPKKRAGRPSKEKTVLLPLYWWWWGC